MPVDVDQADRRQRLLHGHRQRRELGHYPAYQCRQLQALPGQLMAATECGVLDAGIGEVLQSINVGAQAAQCIALYLVERGVLQVGQAETHPRQWGAHFMCHCLRQNALAFQQLLQLLGHMVEGIGQRPHQRGAGAWRTRVQLSVAHLPGRLCQLRDVTPQAVDHHVHRQCHGHHQDQQQDGHAGHFAVLPALVGQRFVQRPQHHRVVAVADPLKAAHVLQVDLHAAVVEGGRWLAGSSFIASANGTMRRA